jgi:TetR/AcrR family transcriptional repressor of nem operon
MRVDRSTLNAHHGALIAQAGRLFRRRGIEAVGVATISRAAGLTHGAFYGHFPSKAALAAAACRQSLHAGAARWRDLAAHADRHHRDPLAAVIADYLSIRHRDAPEDGCALATLAPELGRDPDLRSALDEGTETLIDALRDLITARHPTLDEATRTRRACAVLAALIGGIIVARATANDEYADATLAAAAAMALHAADS